MDDPLVLDIVRHHHGVPAGEQLSMPAQIVQLADVFDSLTSQVKSGAPNGPFAALYDMRHRANGRFSPDLIREFVPTLGGMSDVVADSPVAPLSRRRMHSKRIRRLTGSSTSSDTQTAGQCARPFVCLN